MKILVINAGSSSLKYQLIDMADEKVIAKGNCQRIGINGGIFEHKLPDGREFCRNIDMSNHTEAFMLVKEALTEGEGKVIDDRAEVSAVGHRIVQGGAIFSESVLVTEKVIEDIESLIPLAPLHNKAHVQGIRAAMDVFGKDVPEVVVFDTAFHSTMPEHAYLFAVPYKFYEKYKVRRYGFHGTSHRYVSGRCLELMGRADNPEGTKIISCHLGNGSSITAVKDGKVVDTSMGLTPLDGIMMGTRSGTLDPSVVTFIAEKEGLTPEQMSNLLNKESGMFGISGYSDDRDVCAAADKGEHLAQLTTRMLEYHITKFVGSYTAVLGGVDAIIFTAGIGENQYTHRENVCRNLAYLGVEIDVEKNRSVRGVETELSTPNSKVKVYLIPTNEELVIARDTKTIVENM